MATTNRRPGGARLRRAVQRHHLVVSATVEGAALLLRLPLLLHVLVSAVTELAIALLTRRGGGRVDPPGTRKWQ